MPRSSSIDWTAVEHALENIRSDLRSFILLDDADFETCRLNRLTYGLVPLSIGWLKIDYGMATHVHAKRGSLTHGLWAALATEVDVPRSRSFTLPPHLQKQQPTDHFAVVAEAIRTKSCDTAFLASWARLHGLHAQWLMLSTAPEASGAIAEQALQGALQKNMDVQRHWFAHWVNRHAPDYDDPLARGRAAEELAGLCFDIVEAKRLKPWGPYPVEWFGQVFEVNTEESRRVGKTVLADPVALTERLMRLGGSAITRMLSHPLLTPSVLPPLCRQEFTPSEPPPGVGGRQT